MGSRGAFLAQAMLMVALFAFLAANLVQVSLGRSLLSTRTAARERKGRLARSVAGQVYACLAGTDVGRSCRAALLQGCALPDALDGEPVRVTLEGRPPQCRVTVSIGAPMGRGGI